MRQTGSLNLRRQLWYSHNSLRLCKSCHRAQWNSPSLRRAFRWTREAIILLVPTTNRKCLLGTPMGSLGCSLPHKQRQRAGRVLLLPPDRSHRRLSVMRRRVTSEGVMVVGVRRALRVPRVENSTGESDSEIDQARVEPGAD